jgi:ubiquinone/menaquinone biosynthesis C-methylase UbiE
MVSIPGTILYNTPALKLHEELQLHAGNRLLDIGCGRGASLQLIASHVPFRKPPVGLDLSRTLLGRSVGERSAQYLQGSATMLPLADASFDVVTCSYMTQYLDDDGLLALFQEVRRVLTDGGIALIWDFAPTRSRALNAFNNRVLDITGAGITRTYTTLSAYALEAGFEWVSNAHLRPFLFPPIPRVSIIVGKAPIGWGPPRGAEGLVPDTQAGTLVAGVTRESQANPGSEAST